MSIFRCVWKVPTLCITGGHRPTPVDVSGHVRACPSLFPTFPFPLWAATINFCVFRITFPSGEEWSVKSNLRNARPPIHNFSGCNYANDRSFSDLYPSDYMDGGLPMRQPAFCFRALYHFVTAREPAIKCWGAHVFDRQRDFFCFAALSPSLSVYFCCICLCQCNILIISFSVSLLPCLISLLLVISCSLSLPAGVLRRLDLGWISVFVLDVAFIQRFRDVREVICFLTHL